MARTLERGQIISCDHLSMRTVAHEAMRAKTTFTPMLLRVMVYGIDDKRNTDSVFVFSMGTAGCSNAMLTFWECMSRIASGGMDWHGLGPCCQVAEQGRAEHRIRAEFSFPLIVSHTVCQ